MVRREMLQGLAAAGLSAGVSHHREPAGAPARGDEAPIIVEGLFAGTIRASHLKGMQQGGVHCGVAAGPSDMASYAALLTFFDQNRETLVQARTVAEIRAARAAGKISNVFCWQSADTLGTAFNGPLGSAGTALRAFYETGLRIVGLCYNVTNPFGAGCLEAILTTR